MESIPSSYVDGHKAARKIDRQFADSYIRHTVIGDPACDEVVAALAQRYAPAEVHAIISKGLSNAEIPPGRKDSRKFILTALARVLRRTRCRSACRDVGDLRPACGPDRET